jgi:hypothetical protein
MKVLLVFLYVMSMGFGVIGITRMPEPATMLLFGSNLIGLAGIGRRMFGKR